MHVRHWSVTDVPESDRVLGDLFYSRIVNVSRKGTSVIQYEWANDEIN
jgi:hypothetical protein